MASSSAIMAGMAYVKLTADSAELQKGLQGAQSKLQAFAKSVEAAGEKMAIFGTLAAAPLALATKTFADFDDQMRLVGAVTGATGKDFDTLTEKAKKLGRETSFTAAQVAEGMTSLGRMGFNPQEIDAAIQPMMNLAKATGSDLAGAAEIAANNLRVFKMEMGKSSYMADILMTTANGSAQTLTDLGEALKMAGPQAAAAGEDIKDVCSALGVMANLGIKGSLAGTALRKSYSQFANTKVQEYLAQFNIRTVDANGNLRKMTDIMYDLSKQMQKMGSAEKIAFAENVFDIRGSLAGLSLTGDTAKIDEFRAKLENAAGSAQAAADKMESGIGGAIRRLISSLEGVNIAIGEVLSTTVIPLAAAISNAMLAVRDWIKENAGLVTTFASIAIGAAVVGGAIKILAIAGRGLIAAFSPITSILKMMDSLASGSGRAAAAAKAEAAATATAEKQKEMATATAAAKRTAADAKRHLTEVQNAASEAAAVVAGEKTKLAAMTTKQGLARQQVAESTRKIAAIQAEAAAQVAAERQKIAAIVATGTASKAQIGESQAKIAAIQAEAAAQIAAENTKKIAITTTTAALNQQIVAQNASVVAAEAANIAAEKQLAVASAGYGKAAAGAAAAAAAETSFATAQTAGAAIMLRKQKIVAGLITKKLSLAVTSKAAGSVIMASNVKTLASEMRVAAGSKGVAAAFYAKAIAAKVAAGAMAVLRAAMTAIAAHPITAALVVLVAVLGALVTRSQAVTAQFKRQAEAAREAADAAKEKRVSGDTERQSATVDFERLKQLEELSQRGKLTADEMAECEKLMKSLAPYGAAHFANLDKVTGQLTLAADAQRQFNDQMRKAAQMQIEAEINGYKAAILKLQAQILATRKELRVSLTQTSDEMEEDRQREIDALRAQEDALSQQVIATHKRLVAIRNDEKGSVTGTAEGKTTQQHVDDHNAKKQASVEELANAEKELAKIEEENERKRRSAIENEIADIQKLRDEYMKNAQMKLDAEKAELEAAKRRAAANAEQKTPEQKKAFEDAQKAAAEHAANIQSLEGRIARAESDFNSQIATAQEKDRKRREKEAQPYENFLANNDKQEQQRQKNAATEDQFNQLAKDTSAAGKLMMEQFIKAQEMALELAKKDYTATLQQAQSADSEGGAGLSDAERERLDEQQRQINERQQQLSGFREKIANAGNAATGEANKPQVKTLAAFDARTFSGLFGQKTARDVNAERTAKATEDSEKHLRDLLTKIGQLGWTAIS